MSRHMTAEQRATIRELCDAGYTQVEVTELLGVSQSTIAYWANPKSRMKAIRKLRRRHKLRVWRRINRVAIGLTRKGAAKDIQEARAIVLAMNR